MQTCYKLRSSSIIHELLDQEVILADLDSGIYYSLRESGVPVWQMLVAGLSQENIVKGISEYYSIDVQHDIDTLIQQLCNANILIHDTASVDVFDLTSIVWPEKYHACAKQSA